MAQDFLSDTELFYGDFSISDKSLTLEGAEFEHLSKVLRMCAGDGINICNGSGLIAEAIIEKLDRRNAEIKIISFKTRENLSKNIQFWIPILRLSDRLETAVEKLVELGFTRIVLYASDRSVKKTVNLERINKIALAAMKQSLRYYLPIISFDKQLRVQNFKGASVGLFDQRGAQEFLSFAKEIDLSEEYVFVFGPEGGFSEREITELKGHSPIRLTGNRLRSETAIISAASVLAVIKNL
ncbi:MAG: 16S rRNA (uracil(1498)-N(3))-methyltransferase [Ignavibacteriales bacterium]|nr:16S rRNA (uracil(1498)-N(3))-methyltransferase [Ignavibacteriales bacterium]